MSDEQVRRALQWISDRRRERPEAKAERLIEEAATRFDLTPKAEAWLRELLKADPTGQA